MMSIEILAPLNALRIIKTFKANQYEAWLVGGCIRDCLLGHTPDDWDIATSALPDATASLFEKSFDTGKKHGTITVVMEKEHYEVTTFRIDGPYLDNRRPSSIAYTASIKEDLARRDFTINAIAWSPEFGIFDPFHGMEDIDNRVIRCVGDPKQRFEEDALRMLRAIRFSAALNFAIDPATDQAIRECASLIKNISFERIRDEINKTLLSRRPQKISLLQDTGLLRYILPELDITAEVLSALGHSPESLPVLLTALLSHLPKPIQAGRILKKLRYDHKTVDLVGRTLLSADVPFHNDERLIRKYLSNLSVDVFWNGLYYRMSKYHNDKNILDELKEVEKLANTIIRRGDCLTVHDLDINGFDLMEMGYDGKQIRIELEILLNKVLDDPTLNKKDMLIQLVKSEHGTG